MAGITYPLTGSVTFCNVDGTYGKDGDGPPRFSESDPFYSYSPGISIPVFTWTQDESLRTVFPILPLLGKPSDPMDQVVSVTLPIASITAVWDSDIKRLRLYFSQAISSLLGSETDFLLHNPAGVNSPSLTVVGIVIDANMLILELSDWPSTGTYSLDVPAGIVSSEDGSTNEATSHNFVGTDLVAPNVIDFDPLPNTTIGPQEKINFSVTDNTKVGRVLIAVRYTALDRMEVVHDGVDFQSGYSGTITPVDGGFRYQVFRIQGWLAAPTIQVFAIDAAGNESK